MNGRSIITLTKRSISILLIIIFLFLSFYWFDGNKLIEGAKLIAINPISLIVMTVLYTLAFFLRALAWWLYLEKRPSLKVCISGLFYSMFFNHVFPFKVGDAVRIGALAKEAKVPFTKAVQSVVVLRIIDVLMLGIFSLIGFVLILHTLPFSTLLSSYFAFALLVGVTFVLLKRKSAFIAKYTEGIKKTMVSSQGILISILVLFSWLCEGAVIYTITKIFSDSLSVVSAVWLNSVSVISGLFQVTPGGIATYESVMSIALVKIGFSMELAYHLAILSHGYKFLFSFVVGFIAFMIVPLTWKEIKQWIRNGVKGEETN